MPGKTGQDRGVLFADVVAASRTVAATRKRSEKIVALADLLARTAASSPEQLEAVTAFVAGEPRQGKVGVGWASIGGAGGWEGTRPPTEPALTVADVDAAVTELGRLVGPGSALARQELLAGLFARATNDERDFLVRLLLGELRQGALESLVADAIAAAGGLPPAAVRRALMLTGDLPATARVALAGGAAGLAAVHLEVLRPVLPMLAATAGNVAEALAGTGLASVEWKLDGARIQAHRAGHEVRLYTRNLNDVTDRLPGVSALVASLPATSVILDGEVLGVGDGDRPERFQDTMSRFGRHIATTASTGAPNLGVWWFDCLHLDGEDLIDLPLRERQEALERVAGPWRVPSTLTDDAGAASSFLADALAAGHEGVVIKAADSVYEAGRRGQAWRKVKPVRTFDLVVLAAEWGHGRRAGWLSNLHLGALGADGGFVMVGKTFKGLTDELLAWQTEAFLARETSRTAHVVRVRPELVVEVALDGVQRSTRYPGGVALRFARVRRYRPDKTAGDADPIEALQDLLNTQPRAARGEVEDAPPGSGDGAADTGDVIATDERH